MFDRFVDLGEGLWLNLSRVTCIEQRADRAVVRFGNTALDLTPDQAHVLGDWMLAHQRGLQVVTPTHEQYEAAHASLLPDACPACHCPATEQAHREGCPWGKPKNPYIRGAAIECEWRCPGCGASIQESHREGCPQTCSAAAFPRLVRDEAAIDRKIDHIGRPALSREDNR